MIAMFPLDIRKILRYVHRCPDIIKTLKLCFFKYNLPSLISFLDPMLNHESNIFKPFLLIVFDLWRFFLPEFRIAGVRSKIRN
jgi:hypothetical protein